MSMVSQAARAAQMVLDMLTPDDQKLVLQQLNKEQGTRMDVSRIYSDKELAERYGVDVRTARKWISEGRISGFQNAGRWYTRADWIEEFENSQVS